MKKVYLLHMLCIIIFYSSTNAMWTRLPRQSSQVRQATIRQPQTRSFQARPQPETYTPEVNVMEETITPIAQQKPEIQTSVPTESSSSTTQQISSTIQQLPQKHSLTTTIQPTIRTMPAGFEKPTTSLWSYWTALKNKLFGSTNVPAVPFSRIPTRTEEPISPEKLISWIDAIKTLPEAKKLLQQFTQTAFDDIKIKAHIPENIWTHLIEKERTAIDYIQQHCFVESHPNATWDTMPKELRKLIVTKLNNDNINPTSLSVHYRDTVEIDPFGHDTISVTGPTIIYKTDMSSGGNIITGYEPATITLHKQNIAKLTKNQFLEKLQHTITHLKHAHNEQITLLKKAIGPETFEQYAQPYKQRLEDEAGLLESIKNAQIANTVQQAFLDEAFDAALKEVKLNRKKHGLDNKETSLMICTSPGDGPLVLESIASFEDLEKYLNDKKEHIYQQLATDSNDNTNRHQLYIFKKEITYTPENKYSFFQRPLNNRIEDERLPIFIRTTTKQLLHAAGLNPLSINLISTDPIDYSSINKLAQEISGIWGISISEKTIKQIQHNTRQGLVCAASLISETEFSTLNHGPIFICFDLKHFSQTSHQETIQIIAHEIGHILEMHNLKIKAAQKYLSSNRNHAMLINDLKYQFEIEADICYARNNPELAKTLYQSFLLKIGTKKPHILTYALNPYLAYAGHPSYFDRYHWIKKIVDLHQKKTIQKQQRHPLFAAEKE